MHQMLRTFLERFEMAEHREALRHNNPLLVPKSATVVAVNVNCNPLGLSVGQVYTLTGEGHRHIPPPVFFGDIESPKRTVFLRPPVIVGDDLWYLDIKGYGRHGKELYPTLHSGGDLEFGMFLEHARREYEIPLELRARGLTAIQQSIALLEFNHETFVKQGLVEFASQLDTLICMPMDEEDDDERTRIVTNFFPKIAAHPLKVWFDHSTAMAYDIVWQALDAYEQTGLEGLRQFARDHGLETYLAGLIDGRPAGYIIRALKSPYRVGDYRDPKIRTTKNLTIARDMGRTARQIMEAGYILISPNPGNWTDAGEFMDFEDVARYPTEFHIAEDDMRRRGYTTLRDYLTYTLGKDTLGRVRKEFQEGFVGRATDTPEVVDLALSLLGRPL